MMENGVLTSFILACKNSFPSVFFQNQRACRNTFRFQLIVLTVT